ncbi:MAG: RsmD family RNA methyltransferase [Candidatus Latescibacterota bacterium]|nr:MAG: RsmD family RNA methyltransferase [Candidatus Latescibacterota bacterium]
MARYKKRHVRVLSGRLKGKVLSYPDDRRLRPTMQRVKASVFESLGNLIAGTVFIDLYAASGGIGIEAISRGANFVHFVENDGRALECLAENLERCGIGSDRRVVHTMDVMGFLREGGLIEAGASVVYADPPYTTKDIPLLLEFFDGIDYAGETLLVLEHPKDAVSMESYDRLARKKIKKFGQSWVSLIVSARGERP